MMSETQNPASTVETHPYFGASQDETATIFSSSYGQTHNQQIMESAHNNMTWPVSTSMPSVMNTMVQVSDGCNSEITDNEENTVITGLWNDNFGRMESLTDDNGGQSGWLLPFANS